MVTNPTSAPARSATMIAAFGTTRLASARATMSRARAKSIAG